MASSDNLPRVVPDVSPKRGEANSVVRRKLTDAQSELRGFIDASELSVVYQPIVSMADEKVFACEALARCTRPGVESPTELFEAASRAGKTGALGRLLRQRVFAVRIDLPLFVNVHPLELSETWLLEPDDPIHSHHERVYLEITETVPLGCFEAFMGTLAQLRARPHIHFVVDDLGAGFSNLRRISDLAPTIVKIDKNLITGLPHSVRQQRLLRGVVRLCHDLGAKVVAEGIETHDEFLAARDAGSHYGQGFLWGQPGFPLPIARRDP